MDVIGQHDDGVDAERPTPMDRAKSLSQQVDPTHEEITFALQQRDREEEGSARNVGTGVLRHGSG
jgi:hypothetical protein